jgi:ribosome maturation factor RimP
MAFTSGGLEKGPAAFCLAFEGQGLRGKTAEDFQLLELIDPVAQGQGYEIVRLRLMAGDRARRLQIMAERSDGAMPVDACAALARAISRVLDDADPIAGGYMLEVSSPGVDRPLTRLADFAAWRGCEARIEIDRLLEGQKRFKGTLAGVEGETIAILADGQESALRLPFAWIVEAKLVLNDELLRRGAAQRAERLTRSNPSHLDHKETTP